MNEIVGQGDYRYRLQEGWGRLPEGWIFGDVAAIGIDRQDRVYVFNRSPNPMAVFDRDGNFLKTWGQGLFPRPHGIHMGPDDTIYCSDPDWPKGKGQIWHVDRAGKAAVVAKDLGTTNGTKLNGVEVEEAKLEEGDQLAFGDIPASFFLKEAVVEVRAESEGGDVKVARPKAAAKPAAKDSKGPWSRWRS
mgnify:CR=1 FL=1